MATYQRGKFWWYRFRFAGERIDEPTKTTSRTVAKEAERQHRRSLEDGFNNFKEVRQNRIRVLEDIIDEYLTGYRLRLRIPRETAAAVPSLHSPTRGHIRTVSTGFSPPAGGPAPTTSLR
jgi:hypothetical protein